MPSKINLISPPDQIFNNVNSLNLINLSDKQKEDVSHYLAKQTDHNELNLFVYSNENNPLWLLNTVNGRFPTLINIDNSSDLSVYYMSYLCSINSVFYFTDNSNTKDTYGLINPNFIESVQEFFDKVYKDDQQES